MAELQEAAARQDATAARLNAQLAHLHHETAQLKTQLQN